MLTAFVQDVSDKDYIQILYNQGDSNWSSALTIYFWAPTIEGFLESIHWRNFDILTGNQNREAGISGARTATPGVELSDLFGSVVKSYVGLIDLSTPKWVTVRMHTCMQLSTKLLGLAHTNALLKQHIGDLTRVPKVMQGMSWCRTRQSVVDRKAASTCCLCGLCRHLWMREDCLADRLVRHPVRQPSPHLMPHLKNRHRSANNMSNKSPSTDVGMRHGSSWGVARQACTQRGVTLVVC